jgi:hypothetical protein
MVLNECVWCVGTLLQAFTTEFHPAKLAKHFSKEQYKVKHYNQLAKHFQKNNTRFKHNGLQDYYYYYGLSIIIILQTIFRTIKERKTLQLFFYLNVNLKTTFFIT